jgi:hypothetical protein
MYQAYDKQLSFCCVAHFNDQIINEQEVQECDATMKM